MFICSLSWPDYSRAMITAALRAGNARRPWKRADRCYGPPVARL